MRQRTGLIPDQLRKARFRDFTMIVTSHQAFRRTVSCVVRGLATTLIQSFLSRPLACGETTAETPLTGNRESLTSIR